MRYAVAVIVILLAAGTIAGDPPPPDPCSADRHYPARVVRWIDGDTAVLDIDLGFGVWLHNRHARIVGVDCPERNEPGGAEATQFSRQLCPESVCIQSRGLDYYKRDLVIMTCDGMDLTRELIEHGHKKKERIDSALV